MKTLLAGLSLALLVGVRAQTNTITGHQLTASDNGHALLEVPAGITASVVTLAANKPVYPDSGNVASSRLLLYWTNAVAKQAVYLRRGDRLEGPARLALFAGAGDDALAYVEFTPTLPLAAVRVEASKDGSNWTAVASIPMTTRETHQLFRLRIEPAKLPE